MSDRSSQRVAIVGAGPVGIEAAVYARMAGYDVTVLERGLVADHVRSWGHVRLFSPFRMNSSAWGRELLADDPLPACDALLTGNEYWQQYLQPLSNHPRIGGCIREHSPVVAIGRRDLWKADLIGQAARRRSPFQLLVRTTQNGREIVVEADYVLDCSGTYGHHNWLGAGGIPCPGELANQDVIHYELRDVCGTDREQFAGLRMLVVGSGYSAATTIVALANLAALSPGTSALWLTRSDRDPPIALIADDPLEERMRLTSEANRLARGDNPTIAWQPVSVVRAIHRTDRALRVTIESPGQGTVDEEVDQIAALVGYRPDRSLYEELQVHECYASHGPMKLAAALLGDSGSDCTRQRCHGADTLRNPEPGFFILGAKSYGRNSRFLLRVGLEQIPAVFSLIQSEPI